MTIQEMQDHHRLWVNHNFPDQQPHDALLGICEEAGELCHAHLKRDQGIRGMNPEAYVDAASDALGDIFIYMLSYANANGFNLQDCIEATFARVMERDWRADPSKGGSAPAIQQKPDDDTFGINWCPECQGRGSFYIGDVPNQSAIEEECQTCHGIGRL